MPITRKKHSAQTKVKVVLEALKGEKTTAQITAKYGIHATQINSWKKAVLTTIPEAYSNRKTGFIGTHTPSLISQENYDTHNFE